MGNGSTTVFFIPSTYKQKWTTNYNYLVLKGKAYVKWGRVNNYLNNVSTHVRKGENSQKVGKGGYITEPQFYKGTYKYPCSKQNFKGFEESIDYEGVLVSTSYNKLHPDKLQTIQDYLLTIDMAKELCI